MAATVAAQAGRTEIHNVDMEKVGGRGAWHQEVLAVTAPGLLCRGVLGLFPGPNMCPPAEPAPVVRPCPALACPALQALEFERLGPERPAYSEAARRRIAGELIAPCPLLSRQAGI